MAFLAANREYSGERNPPRDAVTVLYSEKVYPDDSVERRSRAQGRRSSCGGPRRWRNCRTRDCAATEGLMILHFKVTARDLGALPEAARDVRMAWAMTSWTGRRPRPRGRSCAERAGLRHDEVADHAMALTLALRRGLLLHLERSATRRRRPGASSATRWCGGTGVQRFGIIGLGRIGTAVGAAGEGLRLRGAFYEPVPAERGWTRAIGVERVRHAGGAAGALRAWLRRACAADAERRGACWGCGNCGCCPRDAVLVNTARGAIIDLGALEVVLREGRIAGAGLDGDSGGAAPRAGAGAAGGVPRRRAVAPGAG